MYTKADIETLIVAEITGTIEEPEKAELQRLVAEDGLVRQWYNEIHAILEVKEAVQAREELFERMSPAFLMEKPRGGSKRYNLTLLLSAAAILIVVITIYLVIKPTEKHMSPSVTSVRNTSQIQLETEDGQVIVLERVDTTIQTKGAVFKSNNKTLTYSAGTSGMGTAVIHVPAGKSYNIVLSDGTKVSLNSTTKLSFPLLFTGNTREITLVGEAFIDVKKDARKPFIVHLPNSSVRVLGTRFNVNSYEQAEKVSLVDGKVQVYRNKDSVVLAPGQEAISNPGSTLAVRPFNERETISWVDGVYIFQDRTLQEVANVVGRWYGVDLKLSDRVKSIPYIGVIDRNQPIQEFLDNLKFRNVIDYTIDGNTIKLK